MSFLPSPSMSAIATCREPGPWNVIVGAPGMPEGVWRKHIVHPRPVVDGHDVREAVPFRSPAAIGPTPGPRGSGRTGSRGERGGGSRDQGEKDHDDGKGDRRSQDEAGSPEHERASCDPRKWGAPSYGVVLV